MGLLLQQKVSHCIICMQQFLHTWDREVAARACLTGLTLRASTLLKFG